MKFYSDMDTTLGVWNGQKMMEFIGGEYVTTNPQEIKILLANGYRHDGAAAIAKGQEDTGGDPAGPSLEGLTNKELKALLDEKSIAYGPKAKKQELIDLLTAEDDPKDEDPTDDDDPEDFEGAE